MQQQELPRDALIGAVAKGPRTMILRGRRCFVSCENRIRKTSTATIKCDRCHSVISFHFCERLRQLKNNMQHHGRIGRLSVFGRRLEMDLLRGLHGVVVKTVPKPAHHAYHLEIAGGLQNYL